MAARKSKSIGICLKNAKEDLESACTQELSSHVDEIIDTISNAAVNEQSRLA